MSTAKPDTHEQIDVTGHLRRRVPTATDLVRRLPLAITERDTAMLTGIALHGYLTVELVQVAFFPATDHRLTTQCTHAHERLRQLWLWGYLDRIEVPVPRGFAGRKPGLYSLTSFGLRYVRQQPASTEVRPFRPRTDRRNPLFVPHDLEVAALWANLQPLRASGQITGCRWVPERLLRGRKLRVQEGETGKWLPVVPDAYVELTYPDGAVQCCMVEIDRGTHTLDAFVRKMRAFEAYWAAGRFTRHWQRPAFEVLVLTQTEERLKNLWAASRAVIPPDAWSWYSFTTFSCLRPGAFSGPVWRTLEDCMVSLLYASPTCQEMPDLFSQSLAITTPKHVAARTTPMTTLRRTLCVGSPSSV